MIAGPVSEMSNPACPALIGAYLKIPDRPFAAFSKGLSPAEYAEIFSDGVAFTIVTEGLSRIAILNERFPRESFFDA